jgi:hypothetical protein
MATREPLQAVSLKSCLKFSISHEPEYSLARSNPNTLCFKICSGVFQLIQLISQLEVFGSGFTFLSISL